MGGALFAVATAAAPCAMADESAPRAARNDKHDNGLSTAQELSTRKRNGKRKVPPHHPIKEKGLEKEASTPRVRARAEREILPPVIADEMAKTYGDVLAQRRRGAEGMANEAGECRADPAHCRAHGELNVMEMVSCRMEGKHDEK